MYLRSFLCLIVVTLLLGVASFGHANAATTAAAPSSPVGLVINEDGGSIVAFTPSAGGVIGALDTGGVLNKPHLGAFDPASRRLYVGSKGSRLAVFDLTNIAAPRLVADLKPGGDGEIHWVALAGGLVWLAHQGDNTVYAYDPADLTRPAVTLGKDQGFDTPHGAALRPGTDELWVTNRPAKAPGFVLRVNVRTRQVIAGPLRTTGREGDQPNNTGFTPDGRKAYVVNQGPGARQVTVVDPAAFTVVKQIEQDEKQGLAPHALVFEPRTARMFVINKDGGTLSAIDTATDSVMGYVPVGPEAHGVTLGPDGLLYASSKKGNKVVVIDPRTLIVTNEIMTAAFQGPHQIIFADVAAVGLPATGAGGAARGGEHSALGLAFLIATGALTVVAAAARWRRELDRAGRR